MTKFKGFTIYIPSQDTSREGLRIRLTIPVLVLLLLLFIPFSVLAISSVAGIWSTTVLEYRFGLEKVKRQVDLARMNRLNKESESYNSAIQKMIEADRVCRVTYGMSPIDSGKLQVGVGGTEVKSAVALESHADRDIVTALRLQEQFSFYSRQTKMIQSTLDRVEKRMVSEQLRLRETPSIIPTTGEISSGFGYRMHPVLHRIALHEGQDFAGKEWTPILASADGIVVSAGFDKGGYGNLVEIRHPSSGYRTRYAHMVDITVSAGDVVQRGEQIGSMGNTGRSTGTHLHYEVISNGQPINPAGFMVGRFTASKS